MTFLISAFGLIKPPVKTNQSRLELRPFAPVKKKFVPVFVVTSVVALLTMVIVARLGAPSRASVKMSWAIHESDSKALASEWANNTFTPLAGGVFKTSISNLVSEAPGATMLKEDQRLGLPDELMVFFRAYSEGTYAAYRDFRLPAGIPFDWKTNKYGSIDEVLKKPPGFGPPNAYHRWHVQIETKRTNFDPLSKEEKFKIFLELFSGDTLYSNYFSAAAFEQSRIIISNFTTNIAKPWEIPFRAPNSFTTNSASVDVLFPNMGYFAQKYVFSLIKFADSIESVRNQFGHVVVADCYFFVKRPAPDPILPVIARFYWNPNASRWLPDDVVDCNMWRKGDDWPLF